ncbi:MAG TPA: R3H domain-containing nucleic acid-binding protein [Kiritimatiellia bacterium]|nr:R3H domain-containing nucleic acid-binding protein [Kiritimatiellia bacterium]
MTSSPTLQDYLQSAQTILTNLLRLLEFADARIESAVADGQIFFQIETADAGRIIGRNSQNLDAIQFLLNRLFSRQYEESPYCVVDAGQYRARRREKLLADANEALARVRQNGRPCRMPLLNAMERRIIHQALKDCPDIRTHSENEDAEGRKRVVISLVEYAPEGELEPDAPGPDESA